MAKNGENWPKFAKISENFRKIAIFANFDFGGPNGHLRLTKIQKSKKAPGFLPPAQLLPPHHLLTLSTSDTMQHEKMDQQCSMFTSPSVFFCPQSSFAPQYGDDDDDQYGVLEYCT